MKNSFKQLVVMMMFAFATQYIMAQEENGYVKVFELFAEQYIGSANNQHLFYEASRKKPTAKSIKFYDEDMKFIKEVEVSFTISGTQLMQNEGGRFVDSVQVETYNDMLLVRRVVSKKEGDMAGYAYDEVSWYDLDDLSKPKYTKHITRFPNSPLMKELKYKKYLNGYVMYAITNKFVSKTRLAYLYTTQSLGVDVVDHLDEKYLVVMDNELNVLFEGFVKIKPKEDIINIIANGEDIIVHSRRTFSSSLLMTIKSDVIYHYKIKSKNEVTSSIVNLSTRMNNKFCNVHYFSLDPSGEYLLSRYCDLTIVDGKIKGKYNGQGICRYDLSNDEVVELGYYPFKEPEGLLGMGGLGRVYYIKNKIAVNMYNVTDKKSFKFKGNTYQRNFKIVIFNEEFEIVSEKEIFHKANVAEHGISNMEMIYNEKADELMLFYTNPPLKENEETGIKREEKGSQIIQLTYNGEAWSQSIITFPNDLKFKKSGKTGGYSHLRSKFYSLPYVSFDNSLVKDFNLDSDYYNRLAKNHYATFYGNNSASILNFRRIISNSNTQNSYISFQPTPWGLVINLTKPNK